MAWCFYGCRQGGWLLGRSGAAREAGATPRSRGCRGPEASRFRLAYSAVCAPRENVRKRRNEDSRSNLKEFRASIPRRPRRPSLELLEVDHLPPEERKQNWAQACRLLSASRAWRRLHCCAGTSRRRLLSDSRAWRGASECWRQQAPLDDAGSL